MQEEGYQGFSLSGRWLWKPINDNNITLQFGTGLRYQRINGGEIYQDGVYKTNMHVAANMQTYVDETTKFLSCDLPWAKDAFTISPEFLSERPCILLAENSSGKKYGKTVMIKPCLKVN